MGLLPILLSLLIMGCRAQTGIIGVINQSGANSSNESATTDLAVPTTTTEVPSVVVTIDRVKALEVKISWTNPARGTIFKVTITLQGKPVVDMYYPNPATIAPLTPDTEYRVTVQVLGVVKGFVQSLGEPGKATFRTAKVPNTPAMPVASRITHNSATVQWSYRESDWNGPSGHFIVELDQTADRTVPASQRSIDISNLSPAKEHAVRLLAKNENGQGNWSVRLAVFTHPLPWLMLNKSILQEPANGDGTSVVVIGWSKPDFWPNSAFEYDVTVTGDAQLSSRVSEPRVTVPQVKPYSNLTVSVTPIIYGNTSYSLFRRSRNYRTKAAKPGTPIVGVTVDFVGSALVSWNSLQYNDNPDNVVANLTLTRIDVSSRREIPMPQKSLAESQHLLRNLDAFVFYEVTLTVKNSIGSSTSNAVTFRSHATTPSASGEISISNVTSNSAIVSWNTILYNDAVEKVTVSMSLTNLNASVEGRAFPVSRNDRSMRSRTLNGLSAFVRYRVDLNVANSQTSGTSSLRKTVSFMTPLPATTNLAVPVTTTEVPSAVVTIDRVKAREVNISWTNPAGGTFFKVTVTTMQVQTPVNAYLSSPVTLAPLTPDTEYRVTVQVQGIVNGVIRSLGKPGEATFRTEKVPNTPATPIASRITHNSATVQWSYLESDWNGPSGHFIVELDQTANRTVPASLRSIDISNLSPAKEYAIRLLAKNENGQGDWSVRLTVFTHPLPKVTLEDVLSYPSKMASRFATDVVLRWSIPREWISNSALIKFNVTVHRNGKEMSWTSDSNQLLIKDVPGFSEMHVYVFPVVLGHPHEELGAKQTYLTQTLAPFKPEGLKVIPGQYSAVVVWNEWEINDNLSTVIARYTLNNTHATGRISADDLCARRFNLTELQPFTSYRLAVRVINKIDESSPVTHHFKTLAAAPYALVGSLRAKSISSKEVVIEWNHITKEDWRGENQTYAICYTAGTPAACSDKPPWNCALRDAVLLTSPQTFAARKLKPSSVYTFCVAVESSGGRGGYKKISITTEEAGPSKPLDVAAVAMSFNTLNVSWKMPKDTNGKLTGYRVTIKGNSWVFLLASNELSVVIRGLDGGTNYTIDVEGKTDDNRWGNKASIHKVTREGKPEKAPENMMILNVSWSSIRVEWSPPRPPHHGKIIKYMLTWSAVAQNSTVVQVNEANEGKLSYNIQHLLEDTFYSLSVKAGTQRGYGPALWGLSVQTDTKVPGHVLHLNTSLVTATAVSLTWRRPHYLGGQSANVHYNIKYRESNTSKFTEATYKSDNAAIVYNVTGLLAYTDYDFIVTVVKNRHFSGPSRLVQSRTAVAAPSFPLKVMVEPINTLKITIHWRMPIHPNGPKEALSYAVTLFAMEGVHVNSDKYLKMARVDQLVNIEWKVPRQIQPYTRYTISVIAVQQNMTSLSSLPTKRIVEVRNRKLVPALPPHPVVPTKPGPDNTLFFVIKRSSDHGFASFYLVGVQARKTGGQSRTRRQSSEDDRQYTAAKIRASNIPEDGLEFTLGNGKEYNGKTNKPLIGGYSYQFRLEVMNPHAVVAWTVFSDAVDIPPSTAAPPCIQSQSNNTGIITTASVAGVLLVLFLFILAMFLRECYKNQRSEGEKFTKKQETTS